VPRPRIDCPQALAFMESSSAWVNRAPDLMTLQSRWSDIQDASILADYARWKNAWFRALDTALEAIENISGSDVYEVINEEIHLACGQVNDMSWHARTYRTPEHDDCFVILGSSALKDAIYTFAKAVVFINRALVLGDYASVDLVLRTLRAHLAGVKLGLGWNRGETLILEGGELSYAVALAELAEGFVVLHELAHIAQGHLDHGSDLDRSDSPADESICDVNAAYGLQFSGRYPEYPELLILAPELAIAVQHSLETSTWWRPREAYPSASERLATLKATYDGMGIVGMAERSRDARRMLTISPMEVSKTLCQIGWLGPYAIPLGEELASSSLFEDVMQEEWLSAMDGFDRFSRMPLPGLYKDLANECGLTGKLVSDILTMVPPPDFWTQPGDWDSGLLKKYRPKRPEETWARFICGQVIFFEHVFPVFLSEVVAGSAPTHSALRSAIERRIGSAAVAPAWAILIQLLGGKDPLVAPLPDEQKDFVRSLVGSLLLENASVQQSRTSRRRAYEWDAYLSGDASLG